MPVLSGGLQPEGALVEILLGWSARRAQALRMALRPVPPPVTARALLDTGAEITCADPSLIRTLGLPLGGPSLVNVPAHTGLSLRAVYDASLVVVHPTGIAGANLVMPDLAVLEVPLFGLGYEILLGRDVLALCRFFYHGPANRFRLAY